MKNGLISQWIFEMLLKRYLDHPLLFQFRPENPHRATFPAFNVSLEKTT